MTELGKALKRIGTALERRVFKRNVYRRAFGKGDGRLVLEDLRAQFSFDGDTTLRQGPEMVNYYEGQRSVIVYINRYMRESDDETRARADAVPLRDPLSMEART